MQYKNISNRNLTFISQFTPKAQNNIKKYYLLKNVKNWIINDSLYFFG